MFRFFDLKYGIYIVSIITCNESGFQKGCVQNIARAIGIHKVNKMSKTDIILAINSMLNNDAIYNKVFQKVPGASGKCVNYFI